MKKIILFSVIFLLMLHLVNASLYEEKGVDIMKKPKLILPLAEEKKMTLRQQYYLNTNLNQKDSVIVMPFKSVLTTNNWSYLPLGIMAKLGENEYRVSIKSINARYPRCNQYGKCSIKPTGTTDHLSAAWFHGDKNIKAHGKTYLYDFIAKDTQKQYFMMKVLPYSAKTGYYTFDMVVEYRPINQKSWRGYKTTRFRMVVR